MIFSNEVYDKLKWIAQYLLPGLGTFIFAICSVWGLPHGTEIVGTITALDTFLGVLLGISSKNYAGDGVMFVDTSNAEKDIYRLELNDEIENLPGKDSVTFKVHNLGE